MRSIRTVVLLAAATALVASAVAVPSLASAAPTTSRTAASSSVSPLVASPGYFTALPAPVRILDTRKTHAFAAHQTSPLYVGGTNGKAGLPTSGVSSVVFNLTVTGGTGTYGNYVTAFPTGTTMPTASSINFVKGWTGANLVTVRLGTNGEVSFYNNAGHVHLIVDVVGWYSSGSASATGEFQETLAQRLADTNDPGVGAVQPHGTLTLPLDYSGITTAGNHSGSTPNPNIKAMAVNITAVKPTAAGYLTAWSGGGTRPTASVLNFGTGRTVTNLAIVPTRKCPSTVCTDADTTNLPSITVYNGSNVRVHVLIDAWGFYDDGALTPSGLIYKSLTAPVRIVDTRSSFGTTTLGAATTRTVTGPGTVADANTQLLVQNVTAVPQTNTYVTLWRTGDARPGVANLDPLAGRTVATLAYTGVGLSNNFNVYNNSFTTQIIIDVAGSFELGPGHAMVAPLAQRQAQQSGSGSSGSAWRARSLAAVTG